MHVLINGRRQGGRNAERTRASLLAAASLCFAKSRYEDINVREIARYAGVTPALINRYFGSKALLFSTVLADTERIPNPLDGDITQLGMRLAKFLEADFDKAVLIPGGVSLLILLNAIVSVSTRNFTVEYVRHLATARVVKLLCGSEREERATTIIGYMIGSMAVRRMIPANATTSFCLASAIQQCVDILPEAD